MSFDLLQENVINLVSFYTVKFEGFYYLGSTPSTETPAFKPRNEVSFAPTDTNEDVSERMFFFIVGSVSIYRLLTVYSKT